MIKGKINCGKISCSFDLGSLGQGTDQGEQGYGSLHNFKFSFEYADALHDAAPVLRPEAYA